MQQNQKRVRMFAVKVDGEGWLGVSSVGDRCRGHGHDTPEQAKLCAMHRTRGWEPAPNVVLLPLPQPPARDRRRVAGAAQPR